MIAALSLTDVAIRRGGRLLFSGLGLDLAAGEAAALIGRNGAGKTSLLRAIAGLVAVETGAIGFGGLDPAQARAEQVHLAGHHDGLKPARRVGEELDFWAGWCGGADVGAAVEALGLETLLELEVRRLSAGQRRRLALARLVAAPRSLWLLDEPLSPLDADWRARFGELMQAHLGRGGLIVAAAHDPLPIEACPVEIAQ